MANDKEQVKLVPVTNWNELPEGEALQLDLTQDAWEYGAPPPRGVYDLKLLPAKDGTKVGYTDARDPKTMYFMINYEGRVQSSNEDYDDVPVFGNVSTRIFRGKNISTAAGLLVKAGFKIPQPITEKKLAQYVEALLKKEVTVKAELDWRGSYQTRDPKTGDDVWKNVFNHYEEFPVDEKGGRKHLVSVAVAGGGMTEVRAQIKVVRFFGKGDTLPTFASANGLVSAPRGPQVLQPPTPTLAPPVPQMAAPTPVAAPQFVAPQQAAMVGAGDEVDLMLE